MEPKHLLSAQGKAISNTGQFIDQGVNDVVSEAYHDVYEGLS